MSSVSGADSSQRSSDKDTIRRTREDAKQRESDLIKRQTREVRNLNEAHYNEVERLKKEHEAQSNELKTDTHNEISANDHRHLKDMEEIRSLHRKEMQRVADENQRRESTLRQVTEDTDTGARKTQEEQLNRLSSDFEQKTRDLGQHYEELSEKNREAQGAAIDRTREKLGKAHEREIRDLRRDRDQKVGELSGQFAKYRAAAAREKTDTQSRQTDQNKKASDELVHAVNREKTARIENEGELREAFSETANEIRERFDQARDKDHAQLDENVRQIEANAKGRIDRDVHRLKVENRELKDRSTLDGHQAEAAKASEIRGLRDAYQKNVDNWRDQRDRALSESKDVTAHKVAHVREHLEGEIEAHDRAAVQHVNEQADMYKAQIKTLKDDFKLRDEQKTAARDVKQSQSEINAETNRTSQARIDEHAAAERIKQEELRNLRDKLEGDKNDAVGRVQEQMRKLETAQTEKMNLVVGKYEKQIQALKDQIQREHKTNDESTKRLTEEMGRMHKMEVDQIEARSRERIRELGAQHTEELHRLSARNDEKMDQVIAEMKRS